ncbi:DUF4176 domain-containing protein [Acetobacterium sp.]|uniref:DUF4176 domain-containing protein n=1 Tax=Acetobacterium sp. TaxID=1872094 RepID=UPI003593154D
MLKNTSEYLPVGTVVVLKNGTKKLMIFGVIQSNPEKPEVEYDYIGVPYPEGNLGNEFQYLFYHKDIREVFFKGFEDIERQNFIKCLTEFYENKESLNN